MSDEDELKDKEEKEIDMPAKGAIEEAIPVDAFDVFLADPDEEDEEEGTYHAPKEEDEEQFPFDHNAE